MQPFVHKQSPMKTIYYILISLLVILPSEGQVLGYENRIMVNDRAFTIDQRLADSLVIAYESDDIHRSYLLTQRRSGQYEILREGREVYLPDFTQAYICVDDTLFDLQGQAVDTIHSIPYQLRYLGMWQGQTLLGDNERLFFQNGKTIELRGAVFCEPTSSPDSILLGIGESRLEVAIEDLYHSDRHKPIPDTTFYHLKHRLSTYGDHTPHVTTLDVDIEIPVGQTAADQAVRDWIAPALLYHAFDIDPAADQQAANGLCACDFKGLVEINVPRWKASNYKDHITGACHYELAIRRVMDSPAYGTYYLHYASIDEDYMERRFSYYVTFDKGTCGILDAARAINPWWLPKMRRLVLDHLQGLIEARDESYGREYLNPIEAPNAIGEKPYLALCGEAYPCDQWAGWTASREEPIREGNFPLPHMAFLPEGISFTYHSGQVTSFMDGEYHVLLPYASAGKYLLETFQPEPGWRLRLEQFIEFPTDIKQSYYSTINKQQ